MNYLRTLYTLMALAFASIFLGACNTVTHDSELQAMLSNTSWTPTYVLGQEGLDLPSATNPAERTFIKLTPRGHGFFLIEGKAGENTFSGRAEIRLGNSINFVPFTSTIKVGQYSAYEARFFRALIATQSIKLNGNKAELYYKDNSKGDITVMKLERIEN